MSTELHSIIEIQKKIVPEMFDVFLRRYEILNIIQSNQPIGRRKIASVLGIGEKVIRNEINDLKDHKLVNILNQGMYISDEGIEVLAKSAEIIHLIKGHSDNEIQLAKKLGVKKVIIAGVSTQDDHLIMQETAKKAAKYIKTMLKADCIIGVTGGATMASVAKAIPPVNLKSKNIIVVPARGGLGGDAETQANTVAVTLADKINGVYRLLHITENLSKELYNSLIEHPEIKEVVSYMNNIDTFLFGIGRADVMAKRRNFSEEKIAELGKKGAVAEAFGYYFDKNGEIIECTNTVGITYEKYMQLYNIVGIASGEQKSDAIIAISKLNPNLVLVIDEELANRVLEKIN